MANVIVSELANIVGTPVDRLLNQMKEAGLPQDHADAVVGDEEKQILLAYLKSLNSDKSRDPKQITLKRKTLSTLKTSAGRKTVNVEVRKKRTYVKPEVPVDTEQSANTDKLSESVSTDAEDKLQATTIQRTAPEVSDDKGLEESSADALEKDQSDNLKTIIKPTKNHDNPVLAKEVPESEKPSKKYQKNYTAAPVDDDKEGEIGRAHV